MSFQPPLDFAAAQQRRDRGMASSVEHADSDRPGWPDHALTLMRQFAVLQPEPWTVEAFRAWAYDRGLHRPDEERAFGSVTRRALVRGFIERVGYAPAASSNGSVKPLYSRPSLQLPNAA